MLKIAIDFDSTLFPTMEKVIEVYNKKHGTTFDVSQIAKYNLYDVFETNVADELIELFVEKSIYSSLLPYKGAIKAVKTLAEQGCEIYVVTSSDVRNMEWKEKLLQEHFPFIPKNNLIRIHNKMLLNVDVMIEDNLDNLKSTFADRICFDQPWNRNKDADYVYDIYHIYNWSEINNVISEIERRDKEWEK